MSDVLTALIRVLEDYLQRHACSHKACDCHQVLQLLAPLRLVQAWRRETASARQAGQGRRRLSRSVKARLAAAKALEGIWAHLPEDFCRSLIEDSD